MCNVNPFDRAADAFECTKSAYTNTRIAAEFSQSQCSSGGENSPSAGPCPISGHSSLCCRILFSNVESSIGRLYIRICLRAVHTFSSHPLCRTRLVRLLSIASGTARCWHVESPAVSQQRGRHIPNLPHPTRVLSAVLEIPTH